MRTCFKTLAALAVLCSGCESIVIDPVALDAQDLGPTAIADALAMHLSQWSSSPHMNGLILLPEGDPGDLMLFFASKAQSCAEPVISTELETDPAACAAHAFSQTVVVVPAALAHPGVIDLAANDIYIYRAVARPQCGGGSGTSTGFPGGTLEIVSLDATSASVKLDLDPQSGMPDVNGDYTASFCL
jgi:hypothetical protein